MNDEFEESGARRELEDVSARCLMFRVCTNKSYMSLS